MTAHRRAVIVRLRLSCGPGERARKQQFLPESSSEGSAFLEPPPPGSWALRRQRTPLRSRERIAYDLPHKLRGRRAVQDRPLGELQELVLRKPRTHPVGEPFVVVLCRQVYASMRLRYLGVSVIYVDVIVAVMRLLRPYSTTVFCSFSSEGWRCGCGSVNSSLLLFLLTLRDAPPHLHTRERGRSRPGQSDWVFVGTMMNHARFIPRPR